MWVSTARRLTAALDPQTSRSSSILEAMAPRRRMSASSSLNSVSGNPHRLAFAKHGLSGGFQHHAAKSNGAGQSSRGARGKTAGPAQQLLHSGDQLPHHR